MLANVEEPKEVQLNCTSRSATTCSSGIENSMLYKAIRSNRSNSVSESTWRVSHRENNGIEALSHEALSHVCVSVSDAESALSRENICRILCELHFCIMLPFYWWYIPVLLGCLKGCAVRTTLRGVSVTCIGGPG